MCVVPRDVSPEKCDGFLLTATACDKICSSCGRSWAGRGPWVLAIRLKLPGSFRSVLGSLPFPLGISAWDRDPPTSVRFFKEPFKATSAERKRVVTSPLPTTFQVPGSPPGIASATQRFNAFPASGSPVCPNEDS